MIMPRKRSGDGPVGWAAALGDETRAAIFGRGYESGEAGYVSCTTAEAIRILLDTMVGAEGGSGAAMGR
jgi:hypothetical protein